MNAERPPAGVWVVSGDLFASRAQTLVNAVNCVGAPGRGLALAFARRFPQMTADYKARCARGEVSPGVPYLWRAPDGQGPHIINFPTKDHWRDPSRRAWVEQGLEVMADNVEGWGIETLAVPALGCGLGGLDWTEMQPVLVEGLTRLGVAVKLYRPG